ncbi:hypothetical protein SAMN05518855_101352 [Paenibacillus sp. CF384]|nr:hypothetical protein SAMN05518855_101352 [Paenibacillus sp. CF384]
MPEKPTLETTSVFLRFRHGLCSVPSRLMSACIVALPNLANLAELVHVAYQEVYIVANLAE